MKKLVIFLITILVLSNNPAHSSDVILTEIDDYNSWGWKALLIDNGYIQLLILPEIGGRVLHYGFEDDSYMAVNSAEINNVYNPTTNQTGPWSSWGYGGYKVWPAPQSVWNWPPPPYLDWGNYSYKIEHNSVDSVIIYMQSKVETSTNAAKGLQQARRFKIYKNSTRVVVEQILKNVSNSRTQWSIWEVTQAIVDHTGTKDYQNISTYFPSDAASIKVINNMNPKLITTEVFDNVSKFNFNGSNQKIGALLKEGWSCFVDERDEQAYAKVFDIYPTTAQYPDQNTNFQIYAGGSYIEIEVLGPLSEIAQGDSVSYTENWYAANVKGPLYSTNHAGIILNKISYDPSTPAITGDYGIFSSGKLKLVFSSDSDILAEIDTFHVTAAQKYNLNLQADILTNTKKIELFSYTENDKLIGLLDSWENKPSNGIVIDEPLAVMKIYPTSINAGSEIMLQLTEKISGKVQLTLTDLNGRVIHSKGLLIQAPEETISYLVPSVTRGLYFLTLQSETLSTNSKIIIQ